jgi:hypothetical protein
MFSFFGGSRAVVTREQQMLVDIKRSCGIFLNDASYAQMSILPAPSIHVLWNNRDKFQKFVFHHGALINTLFFLTSDNLHTFFDRAIVGPCGNAEVILSTIHQRQCAMPSVVVFYPAPPAYSGYPQGASAMHPSAPYASIFSSQPRHQHQHGRSDHQHDQHGHGGSDHHHGHQDHGGAGQHHGHH